MLVFTFGARKNVELPFITGVMSDLTGAAPDKLAELPANADAETKIKYEEAKRKQKSYLDTTKNFLEVTPDTLSGLMETAQTRYKGKVPDLLTGQGGELPVDISFTSMDDFSPDRVVQKVEFLRKAWEVRELLNNLKKHLDGKEDAEEKLEELLRKIEAMTA